MENGYKIFWTDHALKELADTYEYLEMNFSEKELNRLSIQLEKKLKIIAKNPCTFPLIGYENVRKIVVQKYNTLYYRIKKDNVEILSFFSNRQNPAKRKLK